jgi:hypothetical protein
MLLITFSNLLQKHPGALFLVGAMYLVGNHVNKDPKAAAWCFHKAAEQVVIFFPDILELVGSSITGP